MQRNNIYYGWMVHDVVKIYKEWCCICARATYTERYGEHTICLSCGNQETKPEPHKVAQEILQEVITDVKQTLGGLSE